MKGKIASNYLFPNCLNLGDLLEVYQDYATMKSSEEHKFKRLPLVWLEAVDAVIDRKIT